MARPVYIKRTVGGRVFDVINTALMILLIFVMIYPFWNQLILSLNDGNDAKSGGLYFLPRVFTFVNYQYVFTEINGLWRAVAISVLRVVVGVTTQLFCSGLLAYVTTVRNFTGRRFLRFFMVISMYVPVGLIPAYVLYSTLELTNSFNVYWVPGLIGTWNMMMIASYMQDQPEALIESARMDGARELKIYMKIMFPICLPVFAALAVFSAVGHWNAWFDVLVYNGNCHGAWDTLQMKLREILILSEAASKIMDSNKQRALLENAVSSKTVQAAVTMIVTLPIVCIYPFLQKYFIAGISVGAVKG